jgi:U11/U12 small nuclear ribonucleoprotein SNRNP35
MNNYSGRSYDYPDIKSGEKYVPVQAGWRNIDPNNIEPHDHGIERAMKAKYDPKKDKKITGDAYMTLFVSRLNPRTSEETLQKIFERYGKIVHLRLIRDIVTGYSKGYAFVTYDNKKSFERAWRDANKILIDGSQILVDHERERVMRGWVPRRLGGGLSGKKESGQLRFGGRDKPFNKAPYSSAVRQPVENPYIAAAKTKIGVIARVHREKDNKDVVLHIRNEADKVKMKEI